MVYRHIITAHTKNKELNKMIDRWDEMTYDCLSMIPMTDMMGNDPETLLKEAKVINGMKDMLNDMVNLIVIEDEKLNSIDTRLDGIENTLKCINEKIK